METFHCIRSQVAIEDISTTLECNKLQMKDIFKSGPIFLHNTNWKEFSIDFYMTWEFSVFKT